LWTYNSAGIPLPQALKFPTFFETFFHKRKTLAVRCVALRNSCVLMETTHNAVTEWQAPARNVK